jgi:hypothetical protein
MGTENIECSKQYSDNRYKMNDLSEAKSNVENVKTGWFDTETDGNLVRIRHTVELGRSIGSISDSQGHVRCMGNENAWLYSNPPTGNDPNGERRFEPQGGSGLRRSPYEL